MPKERELKFALFNKDEAEDRLAKLEKMRSKKYLSDEVYDSLKSEYITLKDRSEYLITNLEELKSSQLINQDQYDLLKDECSLIYKAATNLLANKSEGHISEEQYNEMKTEYMQKQSDAFIIIAGIKADIKKSLDIAEHELNIYIKKYDKLGVKFNVGEIKQDEYTNLQRQYQNKIDKSKKLVSELKKLVEAESSKDIIGITQATPFQSISKPLSTITLSDNIPKENLFWGLSNKFRVFASELIERYRGLSSVSKIVAGLLTSSLLSAIWLIVWGALVAALVISAASSIRSESGFNLTMLIMFIFTAIEYMGAVLIEIIGITMIIYGVRDLWQERKT